jgi:hypothetical protein
MENTQPKKSLSGKSLFFIVGLFLFSCTSIQQAVVLEKPVVFNVEQHGDAWTDPSQFYSAEIKRNGGEHELHVTKNSVTTIYKLPSNKLTLIYEMEMGFKDIKSNGPSYYKITTITDKTKRIYKVNTDLVSNLITGLSKNNFQ